MNVNKTQKMAFWILIVVSAVSLAVIFTGKQNNSGPEITVYKSPTCGCCKKWVSHLESNGFNVHAVNTANIKSIKEEYGIPANLSSCHTAIVNGYLVEGHVPAQDIQRLLQQRPEIKGLAVPGMPAGSPGMEQGNQKVPYEVITFSDQGKTGVYAYH